MAGTVPFGCGQCIPCRINKRRQWQWRQWFESLTHEENCFITLTYKPEECPLSVEPKELQLWIKRLRAAIGTETRFRYFGVGEYGERTFRPHYHLSGFGVGPLTPIGRETFTEVVNRTWGKGFVLVAEFNEATASYVTGYVSKKMTHMNDPRLDGRHPEFARMSLRPGIGFEAMQTVAKSLISTEHGMSLLEKGDVPRQLQVGKKKVPLDRYLLRKLREAVGFTDEYIKTVKDQISHERSLELLAVYKAALDIEEVFTPKESYAREVEQKILNVEARAKIYQPKRHL